MALRPNSKKKAPKPEINKIVYSNKDLAEYNKKQKDYWQYLLGDDFVPKDRTMAQMRMLEGTHNVNKDQLEAYMAGSQYKSNVIDDQRAKARAYYKLLAKQNPDMLTPVATQTSKWEAQLPKQIPVSLVHKPWLTLKGTGEDSATKGAVGVARSSEHLLKPNTYQIQAATKGTPTAALLGTLAHEINHTDYFRNYYKAPDENGNWQELPAKVWQAKDKNAVGSKKDPKDHIYDPYMQNIRAFWRDNNIAKPNEDVFDYMTQPVEWQQIMNKAKKYSAKIENKLPTTAKARHDNLRHVLFDDIDIDRKGSYRDLINVRNVFRNDEGKVMFNKKQQEDFLKRAQQSYDISKYKKKNNNMRYV
jgi:hypothetical protein